MAGKSATTPCPRCAAPLRVRGARGVCPSCGQPVRFVDAPQRPCVQCPALVALPPGAAAVRCQACGSWQAADVARPVQGRATCPRCARRIAVPLQGTQAVCPHCHTGLALHDSL